MKFTYDSKPDDRECVALLHKGKWLYQKVGKGYTVQSVYGSEYEDCPFEDIDVEDGDVLFYPGDSITITF